MDEAVDAGLQRRVGWTRLAIGLVQGFLLYALFKAGEAKVWPATDRALLSALLLTAAYVPLTLLAGAGAMRRVPILVWSGVVAAALAAFAVHAVTRGAPLDGAAYGGDFGPGALAAAVFGAAWTFVLWHLVQGADQARRLVAPYPVYFDVAWQHAVQLALSWLFTGAFWLVLFLGAALFGLIGIEALGELIAKDWFAAPATSVVFAAAVHLTDVKAGLTRGARTLALALLSWLTPVLGGLTIAFLLALPFTGLDPLFAVGSATGVLLGAAAALIVFLNAAYHDGEAEPPAVLRWSGRAVAVALVPLLAIAVYGLALRVGQYGWTPSRVTVAAALLVGSVYALGYAAAALIPGGRWMKRLEATNVLNAVVILFVLLALFTPIADPARIAVASQVARLERGAATADEFDWEFLRFRSERYGREALQRLKASDDPAVAAAAAKALALKEPTAPFVDTPSRAEQAEAIRVHPAGRALPASLLSQPLAGYAPCLTGRTPGGCDAFFADLDGDGREDLLVAGGGGTAVLSEAAGAWEVVGRVEPICSAELAAMKAGRFKVVPKRGADLEVGGQRLEFTPDTIPSPCPEGR